MMKTIFLALSLSLVTWSASFACTPSYEASSGVQNYDSITPNNYVSWFHPELSVGVVYAKKKKERKRKVVTGFDNETKRKPFVKVEFELIKSVTDDFTVSETTWFPKIDQKAEARELIEKVRPKDFSFWDRRDISVPGMYGYDGLTSCGPAISDTLLPNQYYLQFKQGGRTVGFEIISGPDDILIQELVDIYSNSAENKVVRRPEDYFREMNGYTLVEVNECPLVDKFDTYSGFIHRAWQSSNDIPAAFSVTEEFKSEADDLTLIDFYSYISKVKDGVLECKIGTQYLVLDKLSSPVSRGRGSIFYVTPPRHRFIEVKNNKINTDDILSMIKINSETELDLDIVKSWIREANAP